MIVAQCLIGVTPPGRISSLSPLRSPLELLTPVSTAREKIKTAVHLSPVQMHTSRQVDVYRWQQRVVYQLP